MGRTEIFVSEIGYGTWGLGGTSYGNVDDRESERALKIAFEKGVNFYDTADLYGNGRSEEVIGRVFKRNRGQIIIASKGGTLPHTTFRMPQDFSPAYLKKALEGSLARLQTDYIDLYLLHSPPLEIVLGNDELLDTLQSFQKEGKIRAYGLSSRSPQDGLQAIVQYPFAAIEVNFNLIDQRALEIGLFKRAKEFHVGLIVRTPLVFGFLSGKLSGNEQFSSNDHRTNWPRTQLRRWARAPELFAFLFQGRTPVQAALRFCLDYDSVATVIPGMMNCKEVEEDLGASDMPSLAEEEMKRIREIYQSHEFYDQTFQKVKDDTTD